MKQFTNKHKGFTLIEMIIVISVMGIVSNVAALILYQAIRATSLQYTLSEVQSQARTALTRMVKELHTIRSNDTIVIDNLTGPSTQITFTDMDNTTITYSLDETNRLLLREQNIPGETSLGEQPLADSVTTLEFLYFDEDGEETYTNTDIHYIKIKLTFTEPDPLRVSGSSITTLETLLAPNWF